MPWSAVSRLSRRLNTISENHDIEGAEDSTNPLHTNNQATHATSDVNLRDTNTANGPMLALGGVDPTPTGVDIRIGFQNGTCSLVNFSLLFRERIKAMPRHA
jgi:hypothetical protein